MAVILLLMTFVQRSVVCKYVADQCHYSTLLLPHNSFLYKLPVINVLLIFYDVIPFGP